MGKCLLLALVGMIAVGLILLGCGCDRDETLTATPTSILFDDDFSDDTGAWGLFSDKDGSASCENGWLHVRDNPGGVACACYLMDLDFADFVLEVDTKLVAGSDYNWHTITARYSEGEHQDYYRFAIGADGTYAIEKCVGDVFTTLAEDSSDHIRRGQGAINHVRVECIGSHLSLSVNGHMLAEVSDSSHTSGGISLGCDAPGTSSEIAFDNFVVSAP